MGHRFTTQSLLLYLLLLSYCVFGVLFVGGVDEASSIESLSRTVSSVSYSKTELDPYEWSYIRGIEFLMILCFVCFTD